MEDRAIGPLVPKRSDEPPPAQQGCRASRKLPSASKKTDKRVRERSLLMLKHQPFVQASLPPACPLTQLPVRAGHPDAMWEKASSQDSNR